MKTAFKIVIFATIILVIIGIILLISKSFLINPYKSEIKYKIQSFKSIQFEIPDFWKESVEKTPSYYNYTVDNIMFGDEKNYVSMIISVEEKDWNQAFLENTVAQFLENWVSLVRYYMSFLNMFDSNEPCKIQCKQEIYGKFKIKDFLESSKMKEKFNTCVKECREESSKHTPNIEDYGPSKTNHAMKRTSLKDGSFFIAEAIGLNCDKNKVVYLLFGVSGDSDKIVRDKIEGIRSHISNSVNCK